MRARPEFDPLLWSAERDGVAIAFAEHIAGEHVTRAGKKCCAGVRHALVATVTVWERGWKSRKLSEVPL